MAVTQFEALIGVLIAQSDLGVKISKGSIMKALWRMALTSGLGLGVLSPAMPAMAQQAGASTTDTVRQRNSIESFLGRKESQQTLRNQVLIGRGRETELRQLTVLASDAVSGLSFGVSSSPALQARLRSSLQVDMAQHLVALGLTPNSVYRYKAFGFDPMGAAMSMMRGGATLVQMATLADAVIVADVVTHNRSQDLKDGFYSSVALKPVEVMKGNVALGGLLTVRQLSGRQPDGTVMSKSDEMEPRVGERYLLLVSSQMYDEQLLEGGNQVKPSSEKMYVLYSSPYRVIGNTLQPVASGLPETGPLSQVRAQLAGFKQPGLPH